MARKQLFVIKVLVALSCAIILPVLSTAAKTKPSSAAKGNDGRENCYSCHDEIKSLKEKSKHAALPCSTCHTWRITRKSQ
jgi:hypothetical protein